MRDVVVVGEATIEGKVLKMMLKEWERFVVEVVVAVVRKRTKEIEMLVEKEIETLVEKEVEIESGFVQVVTETEAGKAEQKEAETEE